MNLQSALTIAFKHIEKAPVQLWNREPKLTGALYLCVSCQWTRNYVVISTFWHTCQQLIPNHNYFVGPSELAQTSPQRSAYLLYNVYTVKLTNL